VVALVLVCASCTGGPHPPGDTGSGTAQVSSMPTGPTAGERCQKEPVAGVKALRFPSAGAALFGIEAGSGGRGVVLVHGEGSRGACAWWPEIAALADRGFHVLAFDHRCTGWSTCPHDQDVVSDVLKAVTELRRRGAQHVAVVAADTGVPEALDAAARGRSGIDAVVTLSAAAQEGTRPSPAADPPEVRVPALFAVARDDPKAPVALTRAMYRRSSREARRMVVLPAVSGHAQTMLHEDGGDLPQGPFWRRFVAFLRAHTAP